jgi:hypothetical protein
MTNVLADGTSKQHWMPRFQRTLDKTLVGIGISTVYTGPDRIIHNPYGSTPVGSDGVAQTSYSVEDYELTDDTLTVNRRATAAEHIDNIEQLQTQYDLAMERADRQSYTVRDKVDQYILALPVAFSGVADIDDGNFGGTPGAPKVTSNSNIDDVANEIRTQLMLANSSAERGLFWVVSPFEAADIASFTQNNGFTSSDYAIKNGFTGQNFSGLDIIISNNLYHTVTLALATNVTAGDTITVAGVTFTARAVPSLPGEFDIGADADATRVIIQNALNGSATGQDSATGYFEVSEVNRAKLSRLRLTATDSPSGNTLAVTANGTLIVSEALTDATDTWGTVSRHTIAGVKGSIQLALPRDGVEFEKKSVSGKHGKEVVTSQIYNATIWHEVVGEIYDVRLA